MKMMRRVGLAVLIAGGVLVEASAAATIFVDCSDYQTHAGNHQTSPVDRYWNVSNFNTDLTDMVDETNGATSVDFKVTDGFASELNAGKTGSALVDWGDPVTSDNWFLTPPNTNAQIRIEGLEAGRDYDLTFYGARGADFTPDRILSVTIAAVTKTFNSEEEGMTTFERVSADGNGHITVDFTAINDNAHLNGMSIAPTPAPLRTELFVDCSDHQTYAGNHQTSPVDRYWNVSNFNTDLTNMVDEANGGTSVDFNVTDGFASEVSVGKTGSALVDWGDPVTSDSWFLTPPNTNAQIRIEGLEAGRDYELTFYGARGADYTPDRILSVTIAAVTKTLNSDEEGMTTFDGVSADGNGHITVDFTAINDNAHLNGMSILHRPRGTLVILR